MDILEIIYNRRTVHSYTDEKVPEDILLSGLRAAIHAPNHKLTWPWRFFILGPQAREKVADVQVQLKRKKQEITDAAAQALREKFMKVGSLLLVGIVKSDKPEQTKEDYASLSAGLQNMTLFLWQKGYGTKWSTGGMLQHLDLKSLVPNDIEVCGVFWVGRPPVTPRPALEQFVVRLP
jgi:nitroreductase